jgi:DegT/DnrJ/EryC1/StrS aminotransferase family protein
MPETCAPPASCAILVRRLPLEDEDVARTTAALGNGLLTGGDAANQHLAAPAVRTLGCPRAFPAPSGTQAQAPSPANPCAARGSSGSDAARSPSPCHPRGPKNIGAGEGGMMVTTDSDLAARAETIREKGTDRSRFVRGDADRCAWQTVRGSYLLSEPLAALIASHIYYLRSATGAARDAATAVLREHGIESSSRFVALHLSTHARRELGGRAGDCPITDQAADRLLRLPVHPALTAHEQPSAVDAVFAFFGRRPA